MSFWLMVTEHMNFANGRARHCVSQEFQLSSYQMLVSDTLRYCERDLTIVSQTLFSFSEFQGCGRCFIMSRCEIQNSCGDLKSLLFRVGRLI